MDKRIQTGDKFEVTDRESPYFGKTVIFIAPKSKPIQMLNWSGKVVNLKRDQHCIFKLKDTETSVEFTLTQVRQI